MQSSTVCRRRSALCDVDFVAFYDKPFLKFERLLETYVAFAPRGLRSFAMAMPLWVREKLFQKNLLHNELKQFSGSSTGNTDSYSPNIIRAMRPAHFIPRRLKTR